MASKEAHKFLALAKKRAKHKARFNRAEASGYLSKTLKANGETSHLATSALFQQLLAAQSRREFNRVLAKVNL